MSSKSNDQGRAFEMACLLALGETIVKFRKYEKVVFERNSSFEAATRAWKNTDENFQDTVLKAARAMADKLADLEPIMVENDDETIVLKIQKDEEGEKGDVRDILIIRGESGWEIGLSVKHNRFAVKHSRLSPSIDFGDKWYGIHCSKTYWDSITPIFTYLKEQKSLMKNWSDLPNKDGAVYVPLLNAFMEEIKRANSVDPAFPRRMVEYLLGEYDFYKVISLDAKKTTNIQSFNLRGTLNQASRTKKPNINIPIAELPDELVAIKFKKNSTNTVELYLNNGWQFSFRIHNASTKVEPSLKFDVQFEGMPTEIVLISCQWE